MGNGLDILPPPARKKVPEIVASIPSQKQPEKNPPVKFDKQAETDKVQFNKRVTRATADTFDILAIRTRRKVPELLVEAAEYLQNKYGKV